MEKKTIIAIVSILVFIINTVVFLYLRANYQYFPNMHYSYALDSQEKGILKDFNSNRPLPKNSIPFEVHDKSFGKNVYQASTSLDDLASAKELSSPISGKGNLKNALRIGKQKYGIYCSPCHGLSGGIVKESGFNRGDGSVAKYWPIIPSLYGKGRYLPQLDRKDYSIGVIYHIITVGVGAMSSYSAQLDDYERWTVAHYVKFLHSSHSK